MLSVGFYEARGGGRYDSQWCTVNTCLRCFSGAFWQVQKQIDSVFQVARFSLVWWQISHRAGDYTCFPGDILKIRVRVKNGFTNVQCVLNKPCTRCDTHTHTDVFVFFRWQHHRKISHCHIITPPLPQCDVFLLLSCYLGLLAVCERKTNKQINKLNSNLA